MRIVETHGRRFVQRFAHEEIITDLAACEVVQIDDDFITEALDKACYYANYTEEGKLPSSIHLRGLMWENHPSLTVEDANAITSIALLLAKEAIKDGLLTTA